MHIYVSAGSCERMFFCQITQIYRDSEEVGPKLVDVSDITFTYVRVFYG